MFENKILGMKKALEDKVEIEWIDAYEMESGWHDLKDAEKITPLTVFSLGYVVKDTKDRERRDLFSVFQVMPTTFHFVSINPFNFYFVLQSFFHA